MLDISSRWTGDVWNMVFVGDVGYFPIGQWPSKAYTVVANTPVIREKPFLVCDEVRHQFRAGMETDNHGLTLVRMDHSAKKGDGCFLFEPEALADAIAGVDQDPKA